MCVCVWGTVFNELCVSLGSEARQGSVATAWMCKLWDGLCLRVQSRTKSSGQRRPDDQRSGRLDVCFILSLVSDGALPVIRGVVGSLVRCVAIAGKSFNCGVPPLQWR